MLVFLKLAELFIFFVIRVGRKTLGNFANQAKRLIVNFTLSERTTFSSLGEERQRGRPKVIRSGVIQVCCGYFLPSPRDVSVGGRRGESRRVERLRR